MIFHFFDENMKDCDQRVLVQPSQAADTVELVWILDFDPGLRVTQDPDVHYHVHASQGKMLIVW